MPGHSAQSCWIRPSLSAYRSNSICCFYQQSHRHCYKNVSLGHGLSRTLNSKTDKLIGRIQLFWRVSGLILYTINAKLLNLPEIAGAHWLLVDIRPVEYNSSHDTSVFWASFLVVQERPHTMLKRPCSITRDQGLLNLLPAYCSIFSKNA